MNDNRLGGIALIIGALSGAVTMLVHPVLPAHTITPAELEKLAMLTVRVHVLAIAGIPFLFLGAFALTRYLNSRSRLAVVALVVYALSLVAVLIAPALSGLVAPEILRKMVAQGAASEQWRMILSYNYMINQAFDRIFAVGSCVAMGLWSLEIVKGRALPRAIGIFGLTLGAGVVIAVASGRRMDAHGFGLIIFSEGIWLIVVGILLIQTRGPLAAETQA